MGTCRCQVAGVEVRSEPGKLFIQVAGSTRLGEGVSALGLATPIALLLLKCIDSDFPTFLVC